ncbi:hypothetical protein D5F01_LYC23801 [Larimichthys crocea]|uniref:Uncharacterized protein n=1 Tax=Larimichthys crocea TaxID=215358 RepID=A0A6G0HFW8_LARCR|nr:hypothetical protein D5F01_LYC23801 [Larimichthys crocea]
MSRKRKEKRQIELCVLELFSREGQRVLKERERASETIGENTETVEKLLAEINTPFSHQSSLLLPPSDKNPPPYEKKAESKSVTIYPQIPVLSQDGTYTVEDDERRVIEEGKATTTIVMRPYTKSKKPVKIEKKAKERGLRKTTLKKYDYDSDDDTRTIGGYDPSVKKILARAERRGRKSLGKAGAKGADTSDSDNGDGDSDWECTPVRRNLAEEEGWQSQKDWEERCRRVSFAAAGGKLTSDPEPEVERLEERPDHKSSRTDSPRYYLRHRTDKMLPVFIRGNRLEYKPWQHTDMSEIMEKLPTLQDGAHPWTSKLDEILVGTQPAMGDIKKLLASLLGVAVMDELLEKAGLQRYIGTTINDPELFAAHRGRMWRALKETYPTNVHPDNIFIEPLGEKENPRAYVARVFQQWRNVTGNDSDANQLEQSILRTKLQEGLPPVVRSKLAEVVGLGSMVKGVYTDHIAHQVDLWRKKEHAQREQDQETLRKLTQIKLMDNKKEKKQALVMQSQNPPQQNQIQQNQIQIQLQAAQPQQQQELLTFILEAVRGQSPAWRGRGRGNLGRGNINPGFQQPQEHVIIVESWDIMRVIVSSQAEVFPEEVSEEDLDGNNIRPGDR